MKPLYDRREAPSEPSPVALVRAWWDAAGPALARAGHPAGMVGNELERVVGDRGWQRQIEELREVLLARLRRRKGLEKLAGIRVALDPSRRAEPQACDRPPAGSLPAPEEILRAAQAIADAELQARWCSAIGRLLQRRNAGKSGR